MQTKFLLVLSISSLLVLNNAVAQTTIESSTQSNIGGSGQAQNLTLTASIGGQPSPFGQATSGLFSLSSGYVFTLIDVSIIQPPFISHPPVLEWNANQSIPIEAEVTDANLERVQLYYRIGGEIDSTEVFMSPNGDIYQATIPSSAITSRGLEYYIIAEDLGGIKTRVPPSGTFGIQVSVGGAGVQKPSIQTAGSDTSAYRMISMPLDLENKSLGAVLEDDLGAYDNTKWRLVDWQNGWVEFPTNKNFEAGKAFFLIVKDSGKRIYSGAGKTNLTNEEFSIPLVEGWNMVGNPFNFPIPLNKIRLGKPGTLTLWTYDGKWRTLNPAEQIQPFEGYAVESLETDVLIINPDLSSLPSEVAKQSASVNERFLWSINILANCQEARDTYNFAAVAPGADLNRDELDLAEPPPIGEYVMVSFPHRDWQAVTTQYSTDVRPEPMDIEVWEFEVRSNIRDQVTLTFKGQSDVPSDFEVWLVDEALGMTQNLRKNPHYSFVALQDEEAKQLKLILGKNEFMDERIEPFNEVPNNFELSQNFPNPFNPGTTIRYGVAKAGRVTLKIFNILGEEVRTLVDEERPLGYHLVIWDGRDTRGVAVAGGIYIYQVRTQNETLTKKMLLLH